VPVVTRNFTPITPTDRTIVDMPGLTYTVYYPQLAVDGNPNTASTIAIDSSVSLAPNEGLYLPVAFKLNSPPAWFYRIDVVVSSNYGSPIRNYLFFQVAKSLSLDSLNQLFINQPVLQHRTYSTFFPPIFRGQFVSPTMAGITYRDYSTSLYSSQVLSEVFPFGVKTTISLLLTNPTSNVLNPNQNSVSVTSIDSAFNGLLAPRISQLQGSSELYIILQFLVINMGSSSDTLSRGALVYLWDISMTIPSPDGEVYVWNEMTGLTGPQTGVTSKVFDNSLTTYETVNPFSPKRGILVVYPTKRTVPRLRVYASSSGGQTLSFYNGVDTLPPTGSPAAQVSIGSTAGWYTVLSDQTEIQWSYLLV